MRTLLAAAEAMLEGYANRCPDKNANEAWLREEHRDETCRYCGLERAVAEAKETRPTRLDFECGCFVLVGSGLSCCKLHDGPGQSVEAILPQTLVGYRP